MTIRALHGRVFVHDDDLVYDHLGLEVALGAENFGMATGQRQAGLVMIEDGRDPLLNVVAVGAMRSAVFSQKLFFVHIIVAGLAFLRRALES